MKATWLLSSVGAALGLLLVVVLGFLFTQGACRNFQQGHIRVGGQIWPVALATSNVEQARGLGGCKSIPHQSGMYFPFSQPSEMAFWMKGMLIPIDIIWITDNKVVGVEAQIKPLNNNAVDPPTYNPPRPVNAVLEVGSGEAAKQGIVVGTVITSIEK